MRKVLSIILIGLVIFSSLSVMAQGENDVITLGMNEYRTNKATGNTSLPLKEKWKANVGKTNGQPLVVDNIAFILVETGLKAIEMETGKVIGSIDIEGANINATPFVYVNTSTEYYIVLATSKGIMNVRAVKVGDNSVVFSTKWMHEDAGLSSDSVSILKDSNLNNRYVVVGTKDGRIKAINIQDGSLAVNGEISLNGSLGYGLPKGEHSSIIIPAGNSVYDNGYFASVGILNGILQLDYLQNDRMTFETTVYGLSPIAAYTKYRDIYTNQEMDIIFATEQYGSVIAYEPLRDTILFKIDRYDGLGEIEGMSVTGKYLLITYRTGKVVCIDFERAMYDAQYHPEKKAETFLFEEHLSSFTSSNPLVIKDSKNNDILVTADNSGTLKMYHMDKYNVDTQKPIEVENGFIVGNNIVSSVKIPSGITSKLSYANNQLIFINGTGTMFSYEGTKEQNLGVYDFIVAHEGSLEKGRQYKANVDIINTTNKIIENATLEFIVDGTNHHEHVINIPKDGLKATMEFTIPENFNKDKLNLIVKVNMKNRVLDEVNYEDNIAELNLDILQNIDLEITNIDYREYPLNKWAYAVVHVKNNTDKLIKDIPIRITIGTSTKVEKISLAPNMASKVLFLFKTPTAEKAFNITGEINYNRIFKENNYSNNILTISASTKQNKELKDYGNETTNGRKEWTETRIVNNKATQKHFWADLLAETEITPNKLPSGNGFSIILKTEVKTNYDMPNLISGAQTAYVEFLGEKYYMLGGGIDKGQSFILPENPDSILYDNVETRHLTKKIYLPVSLADGIYDVKIVIDDVLTPNGVLRKEIIEKIEVNKSMYDYDYTRPGRP